MLVEMDFCCANGLLELGDTSEADDEAFGRGVALVGGVSERSEE